MNLSAVHKFGWKVQSATPRAGVSRSGLTIAVRHALLLGLCSALVAAALLDGSAVSALHNRFSAIHMAFGAGLTAALLYIGLSLVSGLAGGLLALAEIMPRLALGSAMMGILPFAQASDPAPAKPEQADGKSVAHSEMQVGLYLGKSISPPSDVFLNSPDGTDMTLTDVKWKPESFKPSPFYGGRGIDWSSRAPRLGLMVDFTHAKATAIRSQTVTHHGKHKGVDVPPSGPFEGIFRKLEFTHGLNFLTLNGIYRATGLRRRIVPYAGVGFGFMVPHVDLMRAGQDKKDKIHEAQITGFAAQVFGGLEWRVFKSDRKSLFTEYKLTYTTNDVTLKDGGNVATDIWVHQFNFGGYTTPWRAGDAAAR